MVYRTHYLFVIKKALLRRYDWGFSYGGYRDFNYV